MFERTREAIERFKRTLLSRQLGRKELETAVDELGFSLIENEVAVDVVDSITSLVAEKISMEKVERGRRADEIALRTLREHLLTLLEPLEAEPLEYVIARSSRPYIVVFLGINGTGKTTTIAKIAHAIKKRGLKPILAAADTYRAGAIEQLLEHATALRVDIVSQRYDADPAAVARDAIERAKAKSFDAVLIDTAGRMHTKRNLMEELRKIVRVIEPDERMLVVDALTGNDAVLQAREFEREVGIDSVTVAKIDADVRGGVIITLAHEIKKPIRYLGVGQRYEDLVPFRARWFIENLLPRA